MPARDVTLTANFEKIPCNFRFSLTKANWGSDRWRGFKYWRIHFVYKALKDCNNQTAKIKIVIYDNYGNAKATEYINSPTFNSGADSTWDSEYKYWHNNKPSGWYLKVSFVDSEGNSLSGEKTVDLN